MLVPKENTFVIPVIRTDLIERCLETLYRYTPDNFYVIVIDQSPAGITANLRDRFKNLMVIRSPRTDMHHTGNLGFTQASNLGLTLAQTPYVTFLNDDVEFVHSSWWDGIMETFLQVSEATPTRPPLLVNAASIKLPDWSVGKPAGEDHYILPYKEQYTDEDWEDLVNNEHYVNEHLTIKPGSVIDGINLYCSVADTRRLLEVGLLDEFWYPGGADDYDLCCRASMFGYRCVGTTKSWVFHHWSKTFGEIRDKEATKALVQDELRHGDLRDKWGERFDLWGVRCNVKDCDQIMLTKDGIKAVCPVHPDSVYAMPENTVEPL
jgi:GT2 family glycosyltransferase